MDKHFEKVLHYFEEICKVPRCSGEEQKISDWLMNFAVKRGLEAKRDSSLNVLIKKPGTKGYEHSQPIILQGHMDMVCVAKEGFNVDFATQEIKTVRDGKLLRADGTSLGADNGIAVAYILALLDSEDISHPPIEALLTTNEEIGLIGATNLDIPGIEGKTLINLDSEEEGKVLASCAGGVNTNVILQIEREGTSASGSNNDRLRKSEIYRVRISGLMGGHSGIEIHKQRANALKLMARLLSAIDRLSIIEFKGGSKKNAIPVEAEAVFMIEGVGKGQAAAQENAAGQAAVQGDTKEQGHTAESRETTQFAKLKKIVSEWENVFRNEHRTSDPGLKVELAAVRDSDAGIRPMTGDSTRKLLNLLLMLPHGVQTVSTEIPGLVQSSNNVGVLSIKEDKAVIECGPRSSVGSLKRELVNRIEKLGELCGAAVTNEHDYPEWEFAPESRIREIFAAAFEDLYGRKATVEAIHAGLECGILGKKLGKLDMVSVGPDMKDVHTANENLDLESAARTFALLVEVLRRLK